jgi:hypothetical protein
MSNVTEVFAIPLHKMNIKKNIEKQALTWEARKKVGRSQSKD